MDSNTRTQLKSLKSQILNMKLQIENIELQYKNIYTLSNPIGEQLLNLSIQLLNSGMQAFNIGSKNYIIMNIEQFIEQLKQIKEQINSIITENSLVQQEIITIPQISLTPLINEQTIITPSYNNYLLKHDKGPIINVIFSDNNKKDISIKGKYGMTVEELLNKYIERTHGNIYDNFVFIYNAKKLERYDPRIIGQVFRGVIPKVQVFRYSYFDYI